jgi:hypothetical protein
MWLELDTHPFILTSYSDVTFCVATKPTQIMDEKLTPRRYDLTLHVVSYSSVLQFLSYFPKYIPPWRHTSTLNLS